MRRSPMPPRTKRMPRGKPLDRSGQLAPISPTRRKEQAVRRETAAPLHGVRCWLHFRGCTGTAEHWHELVAAGQGGSRIDPRNIVAACDWCNGMVEVMSDRYEVGLKVHSWDAVAGEAGLIPAIPSPYALASRRAA